MQRPKVDQYPSQHFRVAYVSVLSAYFLVFFWATKKALFVVKRGRECDLDTVVSTTNQTTITVHALGVSANIRVSPDC